MARPLAGVRVLDFTQAVAGPVAGVMLADLGAEVIHVEYGSGLRPLRDEAAAPAAAGAPPQPPYNRGMLFNEYNRGKKSLSLDLAHPEGREIFLRLVEKSDVVLENNSPRVLGNLQLEYPDLAARRADIILVSIPAFGLSGPYRDKLSYGPGIDAMSGYSHLTGYADSQPLKPGNFFCDQSSAAFAVFALLGALWRRRRTGQGARIEIAMIETVFQLLGDAFMDVAMNGRDRRREGNAHPWKAPHNVYPCAEDDTWVAICVETDGQWQGLCRAMGRPDLAAEPAYGGALGRYHARAAIDREIGAWTRRHRHYAVQEALQAAGVPAGAVLDSIELLRDPHAVARQAFDYVDSPGVGPMPFARVPFMAGRSREEKLAPAPGYGEHNDEILGCLLGLAEEAVARLVCDDVVLREPKEYARAQAAEAHR